MGSVKTMMGSGLSGAAAIAIGSGTFATGLTAAGTTNADALQLTADFNVVTTASTNQGVKLPDVEVGSEVVVVNGTAAAPLLVYPPSGGQINNLTATTTGRGIGANKAGIFKRGSAVHWACAGDLA
jgi:hypothetical protein